MTDIYDVVGIGFGPSNIALAIAMEESGRFENSVFLESSDSPVWQGEMLFEISLDTYSNIQNVPYRDLVTPRNPRSRYTFLNYLVENDLLFRHLNMDMLMPLRPDYAKYIGWVAGFFADKVHSGRRAQKITYDADAADGQGAYRVVTGPDQEYLARHVVVGTGRLPRIPDQFAEIRSGRVVHQSSYLSAGAPLLGAAPDARVAVIGSSQSSAEIILHLSKTYPGISIDSIMRRYAFPLKDTSPFMNEAYFPEFVDMYFGADDAVRSRVDADVLRTNYGSCDMDVLEELYRQMYYDRLHGREQIRMNRLTDVLAARDEGDQVVLTLHDQVSGTTREETYDVVVLATGYSNIGAAPSDVGSIPLLDGLDPIMRRAAAGHIEVDRGYAVELDPAADATGAVVLNGLCERTHGIGDGGSLSLTAIRSAAIVERLRAWDEAADGANPVLAGSEGVA